MRIKNRTSKTLVVRFQAAGFDEDIERIKPGEIGNSWLHLEDDDVLVVEEAEDEKERRDCA